MRFVLVTFAFLAFAFYELSGGSEFEPRKNRAGVQPVADAPASDGDVKLLAGKDTVIPDPTKVAAVIETPSVATLYPVQVTEKPQAEPSLTIQFSQPNPATGASDATANLQLASLAEGGQAFLQQNTQTDAAEAEQVRFDEPKIDLRQVTGSRVNLRQGPGTTYGVIGTLYFDDRVEVMENLGNGWVRLRRVSDNRIGWMAERFVGRIAD